MKFKAVSLSSLVAASLAAGASFVDDAAAPEAIASGQALEGDAFLKQSRGLILTTLYFEDADDRASGVRATEVIDRLIERAVDRVPRASVTFKATRSSPTGPLTVEILSRSGVAPARQMPAGVRMAHVAIDRLAFELRWSNAERPRFRARRTLVDVDARAVAVMVGRHREDLKMNLPVTVRDAVMNAYRELPDQEPIDRLSPRVFVHILDLNGNSFGSYPLDVETQQKLFSQAGRK